VSTPETAIDPAEPGDAILYSHLTSQRSRAAVHGALWSTLNALIPLFLNSAVFVVTSQYLRPYDFGLVALALGVISFAIGLGPAAFGEALIQQHVLRRSHLDTVFWLCALCSLVLYLAVVLLAKPLAGWMGQAEVAPLIPIIGLKIFLDIMIAVPNALINRSMSFHLFTARTAIATVVSSAVCLGLIFLGYGLWAIAFAQLAASLASCVASFWGAGWIPGIRVRKRAFRELAHYGSFASGTRFLQLMSLDQILLGSLVGPAGLGIFNFSRRLFQMTLDVVAGGLNAVSHTLFSSLQEEAGKRREAFLLTTFVCSLISYPAFMGLAAVSSDAIPLIFGPHWSGAIWPVRGFCVIGLVTGIGVIQASLITSQGRSDWWFYYQLLRNLVTLAIVALLWRYGVTVIVFAIALQTLLLWPISVWMVSKIIDLTIKTYIAQFIGPSLAYLGLFAGTTATTLLMAEASPIVRLIAEIAVGGTIYLALIFLLCRKRVEQILAGLLQRRAKKN
jgi:teichuronic acid exporter